MASSPTIAIARKKVGAKVGADENEGLESPSFPRFLIERSTPKRQVGCSSHLADAGEPGLKSPGFLCIC